MPRHRLANGRLRRRRERLFRRSHRTLSQRVQRARRHAEPRRSTSQVATKACRSSASRRTASASARTAAATAASARPISTRVRRRLPLGRQLYSLRSRVGSTQDEIYSMRSEMEQIDSNLVSVGAQIIDPTTTNEQRAQLLVDTKHMAERKGEIKARIPQLEAELVVVSARARRLSRDAELHRIAASSAPASRSRPCCGPGPRRLLRRDDDPCDRASRSR